MISTVKGIWGPKTVQNISRLNAFCKIMGFKITVDALFSEKNLVLKIYLNLGIISFLIFGGSSQIVKNFMSFFVNKIFTVK